MKFGDYIVLADITSDWPDVFGPFVNFGEAAGVEEKLSRDHRVKHIEIQQLIDDSVETYLNELSEIIEL